MSLVFTEEQSLLQESALEYFAQHLPTSRFRDIRDAKGVVSCDAGAWQQMVDLGWSAMLLPASIDGLEFGLLGMGLLVTEAGKTLAATPLSGAATLSVEALLSCAESPARNQLLREIAEGTTMPAFAIGPASLLASDLKSLDGGLEFVAEARGADSLIALLADDSAARVVVVDLNSPEVQRTAVNLIDWRDYAHLQFDNMVIAEDHSFGANEGAAARLESVGAAMTAAELFGLSQEVFDRTIAYLCEREQFGRKIGSFQALQHRMAKAYAQLQLLKSVLYDALTALEQQRDDVDLAVSHAKVLANDTAQLIGNEGIQLHGGMGITDELDIGLFYKRIRVLRSAYGSSAQHRANFAKLSGL
ncbi:MAG: acyl-CoA/acyl-ACP dehydrogenase [Gammaproteobacteria bacterium]|nr:acyl-CoA/acyl-ACP dehydrogenase [Gammaproteobacteria bacterium]